MSIPVIVISEQKSTVEVIRLYLEEFEKFSFLAGTSDFNKTFSALKELNNGLLIVDVSEYTEQGLNFISKITTEMPHIKTLTISDKPDTDLLVKAMRVGSFDFLNLPLIKRDAFEIFDKIYNELTGNEKTKSNCRVITVYSNKGGVGKTSIAANLALELAKTTKENVALIDLNFQLGDITTFFDLNPSFNISYMLQNTDKISDVFLLSTLEKYKNKSLYILADSPDIKQSEKINSQNVSNLFNLLRKTFSYIIVDTAGGFDEKAIMAIDNSDMVFFVTIVNLPALRNCQRCLELFEKNGIPDEKIQILINRYMENDEINAADVEEVLGKKIYWKIPNNYFTMMSAINKGVPVSEINPDSNVALSYKNLAFIVADDAYRNIKAGKGHNASKK